MTTSYCLQRSCAATVDGKAAHCPKCGGPMRARRDNQARGWILLCLGLFLVIFMSAIATNIVPQMLQPGETVDGTTFTGTKGDANLIFGLFGAVILFGLTSAAYGVYMLRTGRQSATFVSATLGLAALLYGIGWLIRTQMG
jgi:hypothetical protein